MPWQGGIMKVRARRGGKTVASGKRGEAIQIMAGHASHADFEPSATHLGKLTYKARQAAAAEPIAMRVGEHRQGLTVLERGEGELKLWPCFWHMGGLALAQPAIAL